MSTPTSDVILQRMMSLHPKIIDLTLDRVHRLLAALGDPHLRLPPVIHIAGTNGKGSVQAMLRAGFEAAGGRVHAYTSPHLVRFHERIRLAGDLISEAALSAVLDECEAANGDAEITYFEITTVAALLAFARTPADWALVEVGLGGRLDATNVIDDPALTIITPVAIDHQQYLGHTLVEIAGEKAGILKRGVTCVVGPQEDEARAVIEARAERMGARLLIHGRDWRAWAEGDRLIVDDGAGRIALPLPNLAGPHQFANAGTAVVALRLLGQPRAAADAAVTGAEWRARLEHLRSGPLPARVPGGEVWLDGGHNAAAGRALADHFVTLAERPTYLVCGMLASKDPVAFLKPLAPLTAGIRTVTIPGESAALGAERLAALLAEGGIAARPSPSLEAALAAIAAACDGPRVVICGSLYLAGQVLARYG